MSGVWPVSVGFTGHSSKLTGELLRARVRVGLVVVLSLSVDIIVVDTRLLLNDLRPGAAAGHGAAEEDVDEEHDPEEDAEGDGETCGA